MSDQSQGHGWWVASDGKWYPPQEAPPPPSASPPASGYVPPPQGYPLPPPSAGERRPPSHRNVNGRLMVIFAIATALLAVALWWIAADTGGSYVPYAIAANLATALFLGGLILIAGSPE